MVNERTLGELEGDGAGAVLQQTDFTRVDELARVLLPTCAVNALK